MGERKTTADKMCELGYNIRYGWEEGLNCDDAIHSKVAIACTNGMHQYALEYHDSATTQLASSGRWCERVVTITDGNKFVIVASLYGYSGASQDPAIAKKNDELLRAAAIRCAGFVSTPYFICTDANTNPQLCKAWREMLDKGLITDLPYEWGDGAPEYTYRNAGVYQGMKGPGVTRIDTVISNEIGSQMVGEVKYLWDTSGANDHVGIAVRLKGARVQQKVLRTGRPIGITLDNHRFAPKEKESPTDRCDREHKANASFLRLWRSVEGDFNEALTAMNVNELHRIWCRVCELWLYFNQDEDKAAPDEKMATQNKMPRRGQPMPLIEQDLVCEFISSVDQRQMGKSQVCNDALLMLRRASAWLEKHTMRGNAGAANGMIFASGDERRNLRKIWQKVMAALDELREDEKACGTVTRGESANEAYKLVDEATDGKTWSQA